MPLRNNRDAASIRRIEADAAIARIRSRMTPEQLIKAFPLSMTFALKLARLA
jgi:hypothetical protein